MTPRLQAAFPVLAMAAGYWLLAKLSLLFVFPPDHVAALWLPNGAAAGWILRRESGRGTLLAAAVLANAAANLGAGRGWGAVAVFALANGTEIALFLAVLARTGGGELRLDRPRDIGALSLAAVAAAAGAGLAAAAGLSFVWPETSWTGVWKNWAVMGPLGYLWMTPAVLCATRARPVFDRRQAVETGLTALLAGVVAAAAFQRAPSDDTLTYFMVPAILLGVLRAGRPGALATTGALAVVAVFYTRAGKGPFSSAGAPADSLAALQGFLAVSILCALVLAAILREREQAREEAAADRRKLETVLGRMPAVLWTVDLEQRFTFIRGTLLGPEHGGGEKLLGVSLPDFFRTADPAFPAIAAHRRALAGIASDYRQDWGDKVYQCHVEPLTAEDGRITGAVGVAQDVTLELSQEEDRRRVQKMEAVSRLAGRAAHDFNNSLTAVLGYCDLLLDDMDAGDERRQDLEAIRAATERAAETARRLTAFSSHKLNESRPMDLNAFLQEVDAALGEILGPAVARVYRLEPGLPLVRVDRDQLREVLRQLAANARDAMPEGGQLVLATSRRQGAGADGRAAADGSHARLTVRDTGTGLSPDAAAHLFEPYFTTKPRTKDKGLGLATCYGLVRQNDGVITVQNHPGKGVAVHVDFPLWTGPAAPEVFAPSRADEGSAPRGDETILLAEDEAPVRLALVRGLGALGYRVLAAADGAEALALLATPEGARARLLLSDVMMPGMTGVELAAELARRRPDMARLLMSGYAEVSLLQDGTLPPATAFVQKPFTLAALGRRVRAALDAPAPDDLLK